MGRLYNEGIRTNKVVVAVLYTGDIKKTTQELDLGGLRIQLEQVFLSNFDTDGLYTGLKAKIEAQEPLTDDDVMRLIILPLTQPDKKRKQQLIEDTVTLAKQVTDDGQQAFILAGILTATNKFIDPEYAERIKEWVKMTKVARLLVEDAVKDARTTWEIELARKLIKQGMLSTAAIADATGLDEAAVIQLQSTIRDSA